MEAGGEKAAGSLKPKNRQDLKETHHRLRHLQWSTDVWTVRNNKNEIIAPLWRMDVADVVSLVFTVSGEKTPGVPGPPPPNVAETGASAHPEDPPGQPDALHRSQVQRGGMEGRRELFSAVVAAFVTRQHLFFLLVFAALMSEVKKCEACCHRELLPVFYALDLQTDRGVLLRVWLFTFLWNGHRNQWRSSFVP